MPPEVADAADKCPVDHQTREKWLEAAKARGQLAPVHPPVSGGPNSASTTAPVLVPAARFSLDTLGWQSSAQISASQSRQPKLYRLSTDREISTIPRALPDQPQDLPGTTKRVIETSASHGVPANSEKDTGHDRESGNWIYPSQEMFFAAMRRKGHEADANDMQSIVPIHNAVNERAWAEIKQWEQGRGSEACGGPKLVSFAGDSKALTPRARWNSTILGYQTPFDRHDWIIDRCGKQVEYVIDFYSGKETGANKGLNFYLDVRPKLNSWEGVKMRVFNTFGM
ncbi:hypothetical protein LTR62_006259 [Meristemomyces frigidus]|uniref:Holocytochrome c-type synthase n=1 Tax=Meristemomyces frigidus TaxID=1508187 RepID=A0AAN7TCR3_9PEZI|nr:hypothetical protein LTR62_006259 [Meristemomyces frigidus]